MDLNETLNMYKSIKPKSVFDLMKEEEKLKCCQISTMAKGFDTILDGIYFLNHEFFLLSLV